MSSVSVHSHAATLRSFHWVPKCRAENLTCFAPHPAEYITAHASSRGEVCPSQHTVKFLIFFMRNLSLGSGSGSNARFGSVQHSPRRSMNMNAVSSQTVRERLCALQVRQRSSKQPSKPVLPGAGEALEQTRVLRTSIGANGRRYCSTTCRGMWHTEIWIMTTGSSPVAFRQDHACALSFKFDPFFSQVIHTPHRVPKSLKRPHTHALK